MIIDVYWLGIYVDHCEKIMKMSEIHNKPKEIAINASRSLSLEVTHYFFVDFILGYYFHFLTSFSLYPFDTCKFLSLRFQIWINPIVP